MACVKENKMVKYLFKVFDKNSELKTQMIVPVDHMLETLEALNKIGLVKGYIVFDQEESEEEK